MFRALYRRADSRFATIPRVVSLRRTVRLILGAGTDDLDSHNTYAGSPPMRALGAFYELSVTCRGEPDPQTGYLVDIKKIDDAVRFRAGALLENAFLQGPAAPVGQVLQAALERVSAGVDAPVVALQWRLTPTYSLEIEHASMNTIRIRQQFEFAAAHRLSAPGWSDEENLRVFGKCANPAGHGHNYRLEAVIDAPLADTGRPVISLGELERIVDETVVERFDHKHLNVDTEEFRSTNPSVENIARVCFELLAPAFQKHSDNVQLNHVTVWETEKTSATFPAH